ncbi:hypothetical protein [Hugenholtzia roseola]|uniref:hypothetical protein n=1 Tax=Hugenholtzia roseola TaxID=1002 RepID=UPI000417B430|nr:hypothetical protein [Hugenholtzia roseola]
MTFLTDSTLLKKDQAVAQTPSKSGQDAESSLQEQHENSLDTLVAKFYEVLSFRQNPKQDWETFFECLTPEARLINNNGTSPILMSISNFIAIYRSQALQRDFQPFIVAEKDHKTEIFGKIAHRYSYYTIAYPNSSLPKTYGRASLQCILVDKKWRVVSFVWNDYTDESGENFG